MTLGTRVRIVAGLHMGEVGLVAFTSACATTVSVEVNPGLRYILPAWYVEVMGNEDDGDHGEMDAQSA